MKDKFDINASKNTLEDNRFKTIHEFKFCMECGSEVEIAWNGIHYGIVPYSVDKGTRKYSIYVWNEPDTERIFDTTDDLLEYTLGEDRLRNIITKVTVVDRTS